MGTLAIARLASPSDGMLPVGSIDTVNRTFSYSDDYLTNSVATPLSCSLPLRDEPFSEIEFRPYFEGLLPEGSSRDAIAAQLRTSPDDYLTILAECGRECIGDVLAWDADSGDVPTSDWGYKSITYPELAEMLSSTADIATENIGSRLSLGGSQGKIGLATFHHEGEEIEWLRPFGLAASTHILKVGSLRDIPENEFICMTAARTCKIEVPDISILSYGRPVVAVRRFDRIIQSASETAEVSRLHQEDFAQALGVYPSLKYQELEGGTLRSVSRLIRRVSENPIRDLEQLARLVYFDYVVGDCDNHIKNLSFLWRVGRRSPRLSPAYDIVSTTYFERFSRDMAFALGGVRDIDTVGVDELLSVGDEMGISHKALKRLCEPIVDCILDAVVRAGDLAEPVLESAPYIAEDLLEDMAPRLRILERMCSPV